jgi:Transposase
LPEAAITSSTSSMPSRSSTRRSNQVRRAEQKTQGAFRGTRYIWLRNPANLSERQKATLDGLPTHDLNTARAYQIRLAFQDLYEQPCTPTAAAFLKKWYFWATHSRLEPMIEAAHTVKRHWDGILRWFDSKIANGLIEGINSLVQAAKAKTRGYHSTRNLKAMVDLLAGKLDLRLPAEPTLRRCRPVPRRRPRAVQGPRRTARHNGDRHLAFGKKRSMASVCSMTTPSEASRHGRHQLTCSGSC